MSSAPFLAGMPNAFDPAPVRNDGTTSFTVCAAAAIPVKATAPASTTANPGDARRFNVRAMDLPPGIDRFRRRHALKLATRRYNHIFAVVDAANG